MENKEILIELNKTYKVYYGVLGHGRDFLREVECVVVDKIPIDKIDVKTLDYYEKMRLSDRHAYSKHVDYFLKAILTTKENKQKTIYFVQTRNRNWVSVDNYRGDLVLKDDNTHRNAHDELYKLNQIKNKMKIA